MLSISTHLSNEILQNEINKKSYENFKMCKYFYWKQSFYSLKVLDKLLLLEEKQLSTEKLQSENVSFLVSKNELLFISVTGKNIASGSTFLKLSLLNLLWRIKSFVLKKIKLNFYFSVSFQLFSCSVLLLYICKCVEQKSFKSSSCYFFILVKAFFFYLRICREQKCSK